MALEALMENLRVSLMGLTPVEEKRLPTMFDLPSEDPEEPGLPDVFHAIQAFLLTQTFQVQMDFFAGIDVNLYYDENHTDRYKRPDWFVVLGVPKLFEGHLRMSYVIWQEKVRPFLVVELLSPGTEDEDLGRRKSKEGRLPGKWEVYEKILKVPYYVVFDRLTEEVKAFKLAGDRYKSLEVTKNRVPIPEIGMELRSWRGVYEGLKSVWLRWYDADGYMVPTPAEQAERERAEKEWERAEKERERAEKERLLALLKKAGINPESE